MNVKSDLCAFKGQLKTALQMWAEGKTDKLFDSAVKRRNIKRIINNWLDSKDRELNDMIDKLFLLGLDKDGNVDADLIIEELVALAKEIDYESSLWGCELHVGGGRATLHLPDNFVTSFLFGNKAAITMTTDDILELKGLLV